MSSTTSLFYQRYGSSGVPLVLLHGWGFQHHIWADLIPHLAPHFQVYAVDLPGYGNSPALADASLDALSDVLAEQLPSGIWLGWSLGGLLALNVALRHPNLVKTLHLVTSSPCFVQTDDWSHAMPPSTLQRFAEQLKNDWRNTLQRFMALQVQGEEQARSLLRNLRHSLEQQLPPQSGVLAQGLSLLRNSDLRPQLGRITCPTYVSLGARDALVPVSIAKAMPALWSSDAPLQVKVFPSSAHAPFASHRDDFLDYFCDAQGVERGLAAL